MKKLLGASVAVVALAAAAGTWYVSSKQPIREGELTLNGLSAAVNVNYDERGVPHIQAQNQADMYHALGFVHAQDRLFQMEIMRRLARGELAEILGEKLLPTDRLFRTLELRQHADQYAQRMDLNSPSVQALQHYLDGINAYQASRPLPLEFDLLGITPRPFTLSDTLSVAGYTAYSFAAALRTEPLLSHVRDELGAPYLEIFDLDWKPDGVMKTPLAAGDWQDLSRIAQLSNEAISEANLPQFAGSNAWVISGAHTASGKPLLAGDPHIRFSLPSVWYEAHLQAPGYELYGYHHALIPSAMLGHNRDFAWSITMFQNDDLDLIAEQVNPDNPNQVRYQNQWVDLTERHEQIAVKGQPPVTLTLRRSPHGPIINDALSDSSASTPIAMWWAFLETENPLLDAFYQLNRADTLDKARSAAELIEAPGLNILWANQAGDIAWWAAAKLPIRPDGVNPAFILAGGSAETDKLGFHPFSANPHAENPDAGFILSANYQPQAQITIPGYYNLPDRGQRLLEHLSQSQRKWDVSNSQALQLDTGTDYPQRVLAPILADLENAAADDEERALLTQLTAWDGQHSIDSVPATLFSQLLYQLAFEAMADELGESMFNALLQTRALDAALPRLTANADAPWWQQHNGAASNRAQGVARAWQASLAHLREQFGPQPQNWQWGNAHTVTHGHPLGQSQPLAWLLNAGPYAAPGSHEVPNNLSHKIGPAPWPVVYGPSTRRLIDLADAEHALGGTPVGQSGVWLDKHYRDQAAGHVSGHYAAQHLSAEDVALHSQGNLRLSPR